MRFAQCAMRRTLETLIGFADDLISIDSQMGARSVERMELREERNLNTAGEEFGLLIFLRKRETNHCEQDSQWVSNLQLGR